MSKRDLTAEAAVGLPGRIFYTPGEISWMIKLEYRRVLLGIKEGQIPSEKFGRVYKVPAWWVRERLGTPKPPADRVDPVPVLPVATPDYGSLASVLDILGLALVQAAHELRGVTHE